MVRSPSLLEQIEQHYHFQVHQATQGETGYKLETNCGPKRLSFWSSEYELHWAHLWREQMVHRGFRTVDRFLQTRNQQIHFHWQGQYVTVQDDRSIEPLSLSTEQQWEALGDFVGQLMHVFCELTQTHLANLPLVIPTKGQDPHPLQRIPSHTYLKHKVFVKDTLFPSFVGAHWGYLQQRYQQAKRLYQSSVEHAPAFYAEHGLSWQQWGLLEFGCTGFQKTPSHLQNGYEALAAFLQGLIVHPQSSIHHLEAFYKTIEQRFITTRAFEQHLLAYLLLPNSFFEVIEQFAEGRKTEEACIEQWVALCKRQEKLDDYYYWLAHRIDRHKQETISV